MNKLVKKRETERQVASTPPPITPAVYQAELERFRQAAIRNTKPNLMGQVLRFRKGEWLFGSEKQKIEAGTRFVAIMNEARHGWLKWNEDKTASHIVGKIVEGFKPPPRDSLDRRDESEWKIGLNVKKEDPWKEVVYLPLVSMGGEQLLTFSTTTKTGAPAFWKLIDRHAWLGRKHPGQYPIVEIQSSGYEDKRFGWIDTPAFKIVGWAGRPDLQQLIGSNGDGDAAAEAADQHDDMDDEVPF